MICRLRRQGNRDARHRPCPAGCPWESGSAESQPPPGRTSAIGVRRCFQYLPETLGITRTSWIRRSPISALRASRSLRCCATFETPDAGVGRAHPRDRTRARRGVISPLGSSDQVADSRNPTVLHRTTTRRASMCSYCRDPFQSISDGQVVSFPLGWIRWACEGGERGVPLRQLQRRGRRILTDALPAVPGSRISLRCVLISAPCWLFYSEAQPALRSLPTDSGAAWSCPSIDGTTSECHVI